MSRYYAMEVIIQNVRPDKEEAVKMAAQNEWPFLDWDSKACTLRASAESALCGGESEEEFANRLAQAVWDASGSFCPVEVNATYLEQLPFETHVRDQDAYDEWTRK